MCGILYVFVFARRTSEGVKKMTISKELNHFANEGYTSFPDLIDKEKCKKLHLELCNNRDWGKNLFRSQEDCEKDPHSRKTNPGRGICNLAEKFDLSFIEENETIKLLLNNVLGKNYEILLKKFIVSACDSWVPDWLKPELKKNFVNLGPYIKKEYRDVTYFRGIDYHQDSIDWPDGDSKWLTMYVYLQDVNKGMSPLNVVKKSHIFGATAHPHYIKDYPNENYLEYGKTKDNSKKFLKEELVDTAGSVFFWTSISLHGTRPVAENENSRISLRYLIKKNDTSKTLIDELVKNPIITKTRGSPHEYKKTLTQL